MKYSTHLLHNYNKGLNKNSFFTKIINEDFTLAEIKLFESLTKCNPKDHIYIQFKSVKHFCKNHSIDISFYYKCLKRLKSKKYILEDDHGMYVNQYFYSTISVPQAKRLLKIRDLKDGPILNGKITFRDL